MSHHPRYFTFLMWLRGLLPEHQPTYFDRYFLTQLEGEGGLAPRLT